MPTSPSSTSTPSPADTPIATPAGTPPSRLVRAFSSFLSPFLGPSISTASRPTSPAASNERYRTVSDVGAGKGSRRLSRVNWNAWRSVVSLNTLEERDGDTARAERAEKEAKVRDKADIVAQRQLALPKLGPDMTLALAGPAAATLSVERPALRRKLSWRKVKEPSTTSTVATAVSVPSPAAKPTKLPALRPVISRPTPPLVAARPMSPLMSPPPSSRPMSPPPSSRPMSPVTLRTMSPPPRTSLAISAPRTLVRKQPSITVSRPSTDELEQPTSVPESPKPKKRVPPVAPRIELSDFGFVRDGPPTPPPCPIDGDDDVPKIELSLVDTALEFDFGFGNVRQSDEEREREEQGRELKLKEVKAMRRRSLTVG